MVDDVVEVIFVGIFIFIVVVIGIDVFGVVMVTGFVVMLIDWVMLVIFIKVFCID